MYCKLIIACLLVQFIGLHYVTAKDYFPLRAGNCPRPSIVGELDTNRFFKGRWYVQKSMGLYLFQAGGTCAATVANITEDGTEIKMIHYQYEPLIKSYVKVLGTAKTRFTKFMGIYSPVEYDAFGLGIPQFEIPFVILGTDYDNWAIMYMCKQYPTGFKAELGWMMSRKREDRSNVETMEKYQHLLDNSRFEDEVNTNCGPDEPNF